MKIGILTFHCAHNYGAVLQAYGLLEFLKSQGHEVHIIDYRPMILIAPYRIFHWNTLFYPKAFLSKLLLLPSAWLRSQRFDRFIQNRLCVDSLALENMQNDYDAFVFGSDQIWNPKILQGFDPVYFGKFKAASAKKLIAYAASLGKKELTDDEKNYFKEALKSFQAISVREYSLKQLLSPLTDKPIQTVADPTLLLEQSYWEKMAVKPNLRRPYVLVYQVVHDPNTMRIARHLASQIGGEVVELKAKLSLTNQSRYQIASPEAFVGYFKYATCVVTTSFHGTAFSIIFKRPFYTLKLNTPADARSEALLAQLALSERMIEKTGTPMFLEVNYTQAQKKLAEIKEASAAFLSANLSNF